MPKSHRSLGIAQSSRPPAIESGESTQMSVTVTARDSSARRATSSSWYVSGLGSRYVTNAAPYSPSGRPSTPFNRNSDSHMSPCSCHGAGG